MHCTSEQIQKAQVGHGSGIVFCAQSAELCFPRHFIFWCHAVIELVIFFLEWFGLYKGCSGNASILCPSRGHCLVIVARLDAELKIIGRGTSCFAMPTIRTRCNTSPNSGRQNWVRSFTPPIGLLCGVFSLWFFSVPRCFGVNVSPGY